jgi:hypothetical protein
MSDYRIYVIGDGDRITKRIDFLCEADDAAIETAKQYIDRHDVELWQRDRRIATFKLTTK